MTVCRVEMESRFGARAFERLHEKRPWHDGTFTDWAEEPSESHPYHFQYGVRIWVSATDLMLGGHFTRYENPFAKTTTTRRTQVGTRRERVVLDLEDHLSPGMAKAAASTALLNRELGSLSRDSVRTRRSVSDIDQPVNKLGKSSSDSSREVDKLSGRLRILTDVAVVLGPSLVPIAAVGVPAVTGLAAQLGFAATGAGVAILAFQGVGAAVKAVNAAALQPTTANLHKAEVALDNLSPAARGFVEQIASMLPGLRELRDLAGAGLFPGATEGLKSLETALPHVHQLISAVSGELGNIAADAGASLASDKWTSFLDFLGQNAPSALHDMARAAGNTAHAVAALWMATDPLNDDFSKWLVDATGRLDDFASGLTKTNGYAEFIDYVETNGPQVGKTLGAIANAALQIVEATAPLGGPVLKGLEAVANVIGAVADSDLGTPIFAGLAALALFNRTLAVTASLQKTTFGSPAVAQLRGYGSGIRTLGTDLALLSRESKLVTLPGKGFIGPLTQAQTALARVRSTAKTIGKTTAAVGGLALASTGAADGLGLTNTASLALMGTLGGPLGVAIGGTAGLMIDATKASAGFEDAINRLDTASRHSDLSGMSAGIADVKKQLDDIQHTSGVGDFFKDQLGKIGEGFRHPLDFTPGDARVDRGKEAIANAEKTAAALDAANRAKARSQLIHDGYGDTARNLDAATQSAASFSAQLDRVNDRLSQRGGAREYQAALDDFTKSLKENGKTLDVHTEKGRNNQAALDRIASATAAVAGEMKNPTLRAEFLDKARRQFINAAMEAGKTRTQARHLADQLIGLDKLDPRINVRANTGPAMSAVTALKRLLDDLHDRNININVTKHTNATLADAVVNKADGGTVMGQRYPYGDKVHALLAPGEEVITNRNGEADRYRADRAAGRIPAYADGGRVGSHAGVMGGIDYGRLAREVASAVSGDRLMRFRDTRDAHLAALLSARGSAPTQRASVDLTYGMGF
jgi:hypothetical protein